jgi:hypothetical protein
MDEKEINRKVRLCFDKKDDGSLACKLNNCSANFKKDLIAVLKRHLIRKHENVADSLDLKSSKTRATEIVQSRFFRRIKLSASKHCVLQYFIKLTTVHHIPLAIMDFSATKEFFGSICEQLKITMNSKVGLSAIKFADKKIVQIITDEIKNKLISLKMDLATRFGRKVLGNHNHLK